MRTWTIVLVILASSLQTFGPAASSSSPSAFSAASSLGVTHGAHIPPAVNYGKEIAAFNALVGKNIGLVMHFASWSPFNPVMANQIQVQLPASERPAIMMTWEPSQYSTGCNLNYGGIGAVPSIVQGNCDGYIRDFARSLKAHPSRFLLRLAHEMNITDAPWWAGYYGNDPGQYVAMWRRVHDIFASEGVTNVEWVWSPNYASNPPPSRPGYEWNDLHNYYPGDGYVDWIGLSGYNWYTSRTPSRWDSFTTLYDAVLRDLACHYAKPQIIAEIASVEGDAGSPTKAQWIADAYRLAPNYPFLRAVVWFNDCAYADCVNQPDFRVTTMTGPFAGPSDPQTVNPLPPGSGVWTTAYQQAIAAPIYTSTLPSPQQATPPRTYCGEAPTFSVSPGLALLMPGENSVHRVSGFAYTQTQPVSLVWPEPAVPGLGGFVESPQSLAPFWGSTKIHIQTTGATPPGTYPVFVHIGSSAVISLTVKVVASLSRVYVPLVVKRP